MSPSFGTLNFTDARLCGADHHQPIEFKIISRNQYVMENTEVCSLTTNLKELQEKDGKPMPMFDAKKK